MNADRLLTLYEHIADAPDAVARLRRFVLDLAVRGKLVPQDPGDRPATFGKRGRQVELPDPPFILPGGWCWSEFGAIATFENGDRGKNYPNRAEYVEKGIAWINTGHILPDGSLSLTAMNYITRQKFDSLGGGKIRPGDLLYCLRGATFGKTAFVEPFVEGAIASSLMIIRLGPVLDRRFAYIYLTSPLGKLQLMRFNNGTAQPNLSSGSVKKYLVPLPPLAEQRRIVAKVDELMGLCDRLEEARTRREAHRARLTTASLSRLTAPDTDAQTFQTHARFALDALPALTTRPDQIKALRQTILNLAVRGKLVEQNPRDEPAHEMLERISVANPRVGLAVVNQTSEPPFDPPPGWRWTTLGALVLHSDAGWSPRTENHERQGDTWGVLKVSAVSWDRFNPTANKQVLPGTEPRRQAQVHGGDFLISRANTAELIARAVIVEEQPINLMMSDKIVRLRLVEDCNQSFILMVNNAADFARNYYADKASGVSPSMKNVSRNVILDLPLPLPPLAEQRRIVKKVDDLMALCDRLEASLATADTTRRRLLEALLHEALEPADNTLAAAQ